MSRNLALLLLLACLLGVAMSQRGRPHNRRRQHKQRRVVLPTYEFLCSRLRNFTLVEKEILCSHGQKNACNDKLSNALQRLIVNTIHTGQPIPCTPSPQDNCQRSQHEAGKVYFILTEVYRAYPERFWCLVDRHVTGNVVQNIPTVRSGMEAVKTKCDHLPNNWEATLQRDGHLARLPRHCPRRF